ncbi:hypothetical protein WJX74_002179 [Apatococcus lobatus]|uniref:Uncharacterized protein n=1 Tax=Apatococcus lobatus TaxID=904363 RepID=A0AAW1Q9H0_9CHLO
MQLYSTHQLVSLHCAHSDFPEGSLGQRFLLPDLSGIVATVLEDGRWYLQRYFQTGQDCSLPQAALAVGELALQTPAPGQKAFRLKVVRQTLQGSSSYSNHPSLPARLQTRSFESALAGELLSQPSSHTVEQTSTLSLLDSDAGQVKVSESTPSSASERMLCYQQHQLADQQRHAGQQPSKPSVGAEAADTGLAYVKRFYGFACDGQVLVHNLKYGPGDVLQAACMEQFKEDELEVSPALKEALRSLRKRVPNQYSVLYEGPEGPIDAELTWNAIGWPAHPENQSARAATSSPSGGSLQPFVGDTSACTALMQQPLALAVAVNLVLQSMSNLQRNVLPPTSRANSRKAARRIRAAKFPVSAAQPVQSQTLIDPRPGEPGYVLEWTTRPAAAAAVAAPDKQNPPAAGAAVLEAASPIADQLQLQQHFAFMPSECAAVPGSTPGAYLVRAPLRGRTPSGNDTANTDASSQNLRGLLGRPDIGTGVPDDHLQEKALPATQAVCVTIPPPLAQMTCPQLPAAAQGQAESVIILTDSSDEEAAAAFPLDQSAPSRTFSMSSAERGRTHLSQHQSSPGEGWARPKPGSGHIRCQSKPSHTVTARLVPALALLRMTAATLSTHQAKEGLRPHGSRPRTGGPELASWPVGARPAGSRCIPQGASPPELLNLQSLLERSNWALHDKQLGRDWLADGDELVINQPGYIPGPPYNQHPSSAHIQRNAQCSQRPLRQQGAACRDQMAGRSGQTHVAIHIQRAHGCKRPFEDPASGSRDRRKLHRVTEQGAAEDSDDVSSARLYMCGRGNGLAIEGMQRLHESVSDGRAGHLIGESHPQASQLPSGRAASAIPGQLSSTRMLNTQPGSAPDIASLRTFRLTSARSQLINSMQPILKACGTVPALQGANTIHIVRRCKALDAPGSLMGPQMTPSMLSNLASHFDICGLQAFSAPHHEPDQELIKFFEVARRAGEGFECVVSVSDRDAQIGYQIPLKLLPWLKWVRDQEHMLPMAVKDTLLLVLVPREGTGNHLAT